MVQELILLLEPADQQKIEEVRDTAQQLLCRLLLTLHKGYYAQIHKLASFPSYNLPYMYLTTCP